MSETIRYSRIGKEDINFGTGTFEVRLSDGRVVILNQVDLGAILMESPGSGIWTPAVGGTATYGASNIGYYAKVGNMITVTCVLQITLIGTGNTAGMTSGILPYPVKTGTVFTAPVSFGSLSANMINVVLHAIPSGTIQLRSLAAAGASLVTQAILGDGSTIQFTGTYLTD